jgi:hypothetical protein
MQRREQRLMAARSVQPPVTATVSTGGSVSVKNDPAEQQEEEPPVPTKNEPAEQATVQAQVEDDEATTTVQACDERLPAVLQREDSLPVDPFLIG